LTSHSISANRNRKKRKPNPKEQKKPRKPITQNKDQFEQQWYVLRPSTAIV
jgi:hypothetical protein